MEGMKKIRYRVIGEQRMHCKGCESTVQYTLSQLSGVKTVGADHQAQTILIELDGDEIDQEKIRSELEWIGYKVELF